jgi:hypothetical protein
MVTLVMLVASKRFFCFCQTIIETCPLRRHYLSCLGGPLPQPIAAFT